MSPPLHTHNNWDGNYLLNCNTSPVPQLSRSHGTTSNRINTKPKSIPGATLAKWQREIIYRTNSYHITNRRWYRPNYNQTRSFIEQRSHRKYEPYDPKRFHGSTRALLSTWLRFVHGDHRLWKNIRTTYPSVGHINNLLQYFIHWTNPTIVSTIRHRWNGYLLTQESSK